MKFRLVEPMRIEFTRAIKKVSYDMLKTLLCRLKHLGQSCMAICYDSTYNIIIYIINFRLPYEPHESSKCNPGIYMLFPDTRRPM